VNKLYGIIVSILILCLPLSGCYDMTEIDEEVYALVIGIDIGVDNAVRLTLQYPTYKDAAGSGSKSGGGSGGGEDKKETGEVDGTIVSTVEASSLLEGVDILNTSVNRQISLTHAKMIVFSEEFARQGVAKYIDPLARFREARESMRVIVCKGRAEDFIMENSSQIGTNMAKAIELSFEQSQNTGYFPDVLFTEFYRNLLSPYGQPVAIYAGVNDFQKLKDPTEEEKRITAPSQTDIQPGGIPRKGGSKEELLGTAVFEGDRMVGYLSQNETRFFLMMEGEFKWGRFTLEEQNQPGMIYVLNVILSREPQVSARFENGKPVIDVTMNLDADIVSIQSRIDYEKGEKIKELESGAVAWFQEGIKKTIEKTQKEWNSDIFHFGKEIAGNFSTIQELEEYNWLSHYKEAKINVNVKVNIRRTGFFFGTRTIPSTKIEKQDKETSK